MIAVTNVTMMANAITHGGEFHANDVLATVILEKFLGNLVVCRTALLPKNVRKEVIVYDISDYHCIEIGKDEKEYKTCGLIWKEYGPEIVKSTENPELTWKFVYEDLIQIVDREDERSLLRPNYPPRTTSFPQLISDFNPRWDTSEDVDKAFLRAVAFAEVVFNNTFVNAVSKAKTKNMVETAIEKTDGNIMILESFVPWEEFFFKSNNPKVQNIEFVIMPSKRGSSWNCKPVQKGAEGGKRTETLQEALALAKRG